MRSIVERCLASDFAPSPPLAMSDGCEAVVNREPSSDNATDRALLYRLPEVRKICSVCSNLVLQTPTRYRA
jgi:hypothetical protein